MFFVSLRFTFHKMIIKFNIMKKHFLLIIAFMCATNMFAQDDAFKIHTSYLDNGMKVVLCEDHSQPIVYGAVYVHVGSKNDPADNTGMAHYFEHIMFKGTDKIGTIDWEKEHVFLDSIDMMYDKLHETDNPEERNDIQRKINRLSIAATEYAIPNEVDQILANMGGTGINAFTSYDETVYHNKFPSNQLEKWMEVYAERFRNPVFRLFQSELETVYEEKNMYSDNPISVFQEHLMKTAFGEHPYGRPVIGYTEHLKNPQTSKMREFYDKYYAAQNMTLMLCGDINIDEAIRLANDKFSVIRQGEAVKQPEYKTPSFDKNIVITERLTPIKIGALIFPGIKTGDSDYMTLSIANSILSNGETGLLDKLTTDNKIMMAAMGDFSLADYGVNLLLYVPKIIGQSHDKAENLILAAIDSLMNGNFSDDLFESTKMSFLKEKVLATESIDNISYLGLYLEMSGITYDEYLAEVEKIKALTKDDVMEVAKKYYGGNHISFRSKMGFPEKDKIDKPDWKPIVAQNTDAKSDFAQHIESIETTDIQPQNIEIGKDVKIMELNDSFKMYSSLNTRNDIFDICINYNYGTFEDPDLSNAIEYLRLQGTQSKSYEQFCLELSKIGAYIEINCDNDHLSIMMNGFEKDMDKIIALCSEYILTPSNDESKADIIYDQTKMMHKMIKNDASTCFNALYSYVMRGENSAYMRNTPIKQWRKLGGQHYLDEIAEAVKRDGYVTYCGNMPNRVVAKTLTNSGLIRENAIKGTDDIFPMNEFDENAVFTLHNKSFAQSNIAFYIKGGLHTRTEKCTAQLFNKYFGHDMYSIVFQEIREFRSLGYSAYATYNSDMLNRYNSFLFCSVGTQSDKTIEAVNAMLGLVNDMPVRPEKFEVAKTSLLRDLESNYIGFRSKPAMVHQWEEQGLSYDPRPQQIENIRKMTFSDVNKFYKKNIKGRPTVIIMNGNMKRIDMKELNKFGTVKQLKLKDIMRF